jgi:hypothetical protein
VRPLSCLSPRMHYNFVRIHQSLRVTPAMAAGVTQRLWSLTVARVIEDWEVERAMKPGDLSWSPKTRQLVKVEPCP